MFTSEQLDVLQAAAEAATPGPWELSCPRPDGRNAVRVNYAPIFPGDPITGTWIIFDTAPEDASFIAAANPAVVLELVAEHRRVLAELERSKRGGKTLGKVIKQQCDDIVRITDSAHMIDETGDGDWGAVWELGFDLRDQLDAALARIARVEAQHQPNADIGRWEVYDVDVPERVDTFNCDERAAREIAEAWGNVSGTVSSYGIRRALTEGEPSE